MAVPSAYCDLGKSARDIFGKGFGFGFVKLDAKTTTSNGVGFTVSGSSSNDTGKVDASLETKYSWKEYGLSFKEKWNTDNTLSTEVTIEDQIAQGLKVTLDTSFSPQTGKKSGQIKTGYKRDYLNLTTDVNFDFAGPTVNSTGVVGYEGWLAGFQVSFDTAESKLKKSNFALGYKTGDFQLHTAVNDGSDFTGTVYQRVNDSMETAINVGWASNTNTTRFALGAKYVLDSDASINAKINNNSQVGLGYTQAIRPGVKLTLAALVDGKSLNQGGHKLGVGIDLAA